MLLPYHLPEVFLDIVGIITPFNSASLPHVLIVGMTINIAPGTPNVTIWIATVVFGFADRWVVGYHAILPRRARLSGFGGTFITAIFSAELCAFAFESLGETRYFHDLTISNFLCEITNRGGVTEF